MLKHISHGVLVHIDDQKVTHKLNCLKVSGKVHVDSNRHLPACIGAIQRSTLLLDTYGYTHYKIKILEPGELLVEGTKNEQLPFTHRELGFAGLDRLTRSTVASHREAKRQ